MANSKITGLTEISASQVDVDSDFLVLVDVSDTTMAESGTNKKITPAALREIIAGGQTAGVVLDFSAPSFYGTHDVFETGETIEAVVDNAVIGVENVLFHKALSEPDYPASFKKLTSSGNYDPAKVNIITCRYYEDDFITYKIEQQQ